MIFSFDGIVGNSEKILFPVIRIEYNAPFRHIRAVRFLADGRTLEAGKILRELSLDPTLPYYMKYRVLSGLEESANSIGDFRTAYSASRRKLELIDKYRSAELP